MQIEILVQAFDIQRDGKTVRYPESFLKGIFVVERDSTSSTRDKMKWCFAMPGETRPTDFSAASGSNHKLIELERFNEREATATIRRSRGHAVQHSRGWTKSVFIESPTVEALAALKELKRLNSATLGIADNDVVKHLSGHSTIRNLRFDCNAPAKVIGELVATLPQLETLEFSCSEFTKSYATAIAKSKSLKTLFLPKLHIDEAKKLLVDLPDLKVRKPPATASGFGGRGAGGHF